MYGIMLFGLPGSGKSTAGKELANLYGYEYISSGDIAREMASCDPRLQANLNSGAMAPEIQMRHMVKYKITQCIAANKPFILDGFPRFDYQDMFLQDNFPNLAMIRVLVKVSDQTAIARSLMRNRDDDMAIHRRIKYYHEHTEQLTKGCPVIIDNEGKHTAYELADKIYMEVMDIVDNSKI